MLGWLAVGLLTALAAILAIGAGARRMAPPPARRNELMVDWTREWRRALNSLEPAPTDRRRRPASRSSSRAS